MSMSEEYRRNLAAEEWAAREPEIALAAVRAHPATVHWIDTAKQTPDERAASTAILDADADRMLELFQRVYGTIPPADVFKLGADDAHRRTRAALLWWARSTANSNGLSVLADAHATVREPDRRAVRMLPRFGRVDAGEVRMLPGFEVGLPAVKDAMLPGFEGVSAAIPSWLLAVYDSTGGPTSSRGGAPWLLRLFVGSLLSLPLEFRDGRSQSMTLTTGQLAKWLQPAGWNRRAADFEKLRAALLGLQDLRVPLAGGGLLQVVTCKLLPTVFDRGRSPVIVAVSIPGGAARGAPVDWELLHRYGAESAGLYRAYLSVSAVVDYSARGGRALTKTIPAPVVDASGQPKRRRGGKMLRSKVDRIPNPAERYVGWLSPDDLRRMVGLKADHRENRRRARSDLERLEADGVVVVEHGTSANRNRVRLWGPDGDQKSASLGDAKRVTR